MNKRIKSLIYASIIGLIIVAIFLGFLSSMANPISWLLIAVLVLIPFLYKEKASRQLIVWQDEYSVGIEHIDQDHKKLINLLNQFSTAYDHAMSEEYERAALKELVDYTKYHFQREEKLMAEYGYPDFEAHKAQHKNMITKVESFVKLYEEKGHESLDEVSAFLIDWLLNHINGSDKAYGPYLNEQGVH